MPSLTVMMAQMDPLVGDIPGNTRRVIEAARAARQAGADCVVFPELTLTAYPPEDLLLRRSLDGRIETALAELRRSLPPDLWCVVGYPRRGTRGLFNTAGVFKGGHCVAEYAKQYLPNYQVFDEMRYFVPGTEPCVFDLDGLPVAVTICEDIWEPVPMVQAREAGARLMLNLNASPFHIDKPLHRRELLATRAREGGMPILYVNQVGGQDELVFDGGSLAVSVAGETQVAAPLYEAGLYPATLDTTAGTWTGDRAPWPDFHAGVYDALVLGVRDYVNKNGFPGVVIGVSGGIDSALTLAVAVDALGSERVETVMMPFRYTASISQEDAEAEARALGVRYEVISIEPIYEAFITALSEPFRGLAPDVTEENLQARCRGVLLMALSNKQGTLVLTTGNKSEMAVGYSTLYGDMAGGFDVLKDVPKTLVYALARYRNTRSPVIPERVIERPPSAELAPDQQDQDSLPDYAVLDPILERYVERDMSAHAIIAEGFDRDVVLKVIGLVDRNEYKRRQAPVGVRITERGFGRDRRYPITSGWVPGD